MKRTLIVVISLLVVCWVIIYLSDEQVERDIWMKDSMFYLSEDSPSIVVWEGKPKSWNKSILYILPKQTRQLAEFIEVYEVETIGLYPYLPPKDFFLQKLPFHSLEEAEAFVRKNLWEGDKDRKDVMWR